MNTPSVVAFAMLAITSIAAAQRPETTTCAFNFSSGTDRAQTRYCVTENGNIAEFGISVSPPIEFLTSPVSEGYGFCDSTNPVNPTSYYDYARAATNNWNAATAELKDPATLLVTRTTTDGRWSLTQKFSQIPAASTAYGAVRITMALTNLTTHNRFAVLQRHVNVDAGGSTFNDFDATNSTTMAMESGNWGISTTGSFELVLGDYSLAFNQSVPDGPDVCALNTNVVQGFYQGDGSSEQRFGLSIAAGATKTATVTYKPI